MLFCNRAAVALHIGGLLWVNGREAFNVRLGQERTFRTGKTMSALPLIPLQNSTAHEGWGER